MPLIRNSISGAQIVASAKVARKFNFTVAQGTTSLENIAQLQVNTLPAATFYCLLTAGPANCTFTPQWAVDNRPAPIVGIEPDWVPASIPQVLVLDVPVLLSIRLIANMISGIVTVPGGGANATVVMILAASQ